MLKKYTYYFFIFLFSFFFFTPPIFSAEPPQYVPGQLIVKYKQGKKQSVKQQYSSLIQSENPLINNQSLQQDTLCNQLSLLQVTVGKEDEVLTKLKSNPDVEYAEKDGYYKVAETPNDPWYSQQWSYYNHEDYYVVNLEPIWGKPTQNKDGIIAIIDTGVDVTHEDLKDRIWTNPGEIPSNGVDDDGNGFIDDINGWNTYTNTNNLFDDYNHGTLVAGVVAATSNNGKGIVGASWEGKIMVLKADMPPTYPGYFSYSAIEKALRYASDNQQVKVINLSLGGYGYSQSQRECITYALNKGKVVVAAAGNDNKDFKTNPFYPAAYKGVVAAAAFYPDGLASFSNYGYRIDVAAPGSQIYTTQKGGGYGNTSGTSFSSPLVAGVSLLFSQYYPDYTNQEITQVLRTWSLRNLSTCFNYDPNCNRNTWNRNWGYGRLSGVETINHRCGEEDPVRSTVYISEPDDRQTIQSQGILTIKGTAQSNVFQKYTLEWGRGGNPTSWSKEGITLANNGTQQVQNGVLGTLDMSKFLTSDFYLIRAVASGSAMCLNNVVGEDRIGIFVQRQFTVSGKVTNLSKQPVPNVYVQFYQNNTGVGWVQTNTNGEYTRKDLAAGAYSWVPSLGTGLKETYIPASRSGTLAEGQPDLVNQDFVQQLWSPTSIPTPTTVPTIVPTIVPTVPPTVIPTITKIPTVIPTIKPTNTPTPTPKPTPIQYPPEVITEKIPYAKVNRPYVALIAATDKNRDYISMNIEGFPKNFQQGGCIKLPGFTSCLIYGIPRQKELFPLMVYVVDSTQRRNGKRLFLLVQ